VLQCRTFVADDRREMDMGKLVYAVLGSLDGYYEDAQGQFDWAAPDEELHAFVNDLERPIGTYLYGRRMYEVMSFWETAPTDGEPEPFRDYAELWRATDKVVFSRSLAEPASERTRIERELDPEAIRRWKAESPADLSIGGGELAGQALRAGLVDEFHLFLCPVVVGGGKRTLPGGVRTSLELLDQRCFAGGAAYLHYRVVPEGGPPAA
jgi:dihydrofolate reductase